MIGPIRCPACGFAGSDAVWRDWFCRRCGRLNLPLYRRDHADPARAAGMGKAEVRAEFAAAGMDFVPLPKGPRRSA